MEFSGKYKSFAICDGWVCGKLLQRIFVANISSDNFIQKIVKKNNLSQIYPLQFKNIRYSKEKKIFGRERIKYKGRENKMEIDFGGRKRYGQIEN